MRSPPVDTCTLRAEARCPWRRFLFRAWRAATACRSGLVCGRPLLAPCGSHRQGTQGRPARPRQRPGRRQRSQTTAQASGLPAPAASPVNTLPTKSGNKQVDALIAGQTYWWHDATNSASAPTSSGMSNARHALTFSFKTQANSASAGDNYGFKEMSDTEKAAVRQALSYVAVACRSHLHRSRERRQPPVRHQQAEPPKLGLRVLPEHGCGRRRVGVPGERRIRSRDHRLVAGHRRVGDAHSRDWSCARAQASRGLQCRRGQDARALSEEGGRQHAEHGHVVLRPEERHHRQHHAERAGEIPALPRLGPAGRLSDAGHRGAAVPVWREQGRGCQRGRDLRVCADRQQQQPVPEDHLEPERRQRHRRVSADPEQRHHKKIISAHCHKK